MTSQVNPYNIDGTYPVAGQDNDSQGFRDNFTNTSNNFAFIKAEVEDLQAKAVLKSALTNTTLNNDLSASGTTLNNAQLTGYKETFFNNGSLTGSQVINFNSGNFQKITTGGSITLASFSNWPTSGIGGRLKLWVSVTSTAYTLTLPAGATIGFPSEIAGYSAGVITFDATGDYVYEFTSTDAAATLLVTDVTRASNRVRGPLTVTGNLTASGTNSTITGTFTGNVVASGTIIDTGYQYSAAVTDFNITITNNVSRLILNPAAGLVNGTVTLPSANVDATIVTVSSTQAITNFQVKPNTGTTLVPSANITQTAGSSSTFFFHASASKWYKIG
jgi:hypothetical protein